VSGPNYWKESRKSESIKYSPVKFASFKRSYLKVSSCDVLLYSFAITVPIPAEKEAG